MNDRGKDPIKKYRVKRAFKWLKRLLVPRSVRANKVVRKWRMRDMADWRQNEREYKLNKHPFASRPPPLAVNLVCF